MNHADLIHNYLKEHKEATSAQLFKALGIWRVSDAILKLRKYAKVKTTMIKVKNRRKETVMVARYSLGK
jgi:hypothetical protein